MIKPIPNLLAILPGFIPSTIICVVKPLVKLHRAGLITAKITLEPFVHRRNLSWSDLVIFCRNTEPRYAYILNFLLKQRIPIIYDLDDNLFELSPDSEHGRYHRNPERLGMLTQYIKSADLVRVYSEPLLQKALTLNKTVEKVTGPIDLDLIKKPKSCRNCQGIKIGFATSRSSDELCSIFLPALVRILDRYGDQVEAHFWGFMPSFLKKYPRVYHHKFIPDYDKFLSRFSQAGYDIGLAPLKDDIFHRSKTNNKFREYGACNIAGIYSKVDVYSSCIHDGETGLLVPNDEEAWYKAIVRMVEDDDLRSRIQKNAREYVQNQYSQEIFDGVFWDQIQQVLEGTAGPSFPNRFVSNDRLLTRRMDTLFDVPTSRTKELNIACRLGAELQKTIWRLRNDGLQANLQLFKKRLHDYRMAIRLHFM